MLTRRRFLSGHGSVAALAVVAGCTDSGTDTPDGTESEETDGSGDVDGNTDDPSPDTGGDGEDGDTEPDGTGTDDEDSDTANESGNPDDPDLREANVVDVAFEGGDGTYEFEVTLHHDDDGEDGYANWWQIERLDGTQLGRRELLHAHSRQPFTRSETIEIPDGVDCVVVRGHDETHGYGGLAATVDLASGATRTIAQGSEKRPFGADECPE